MTPPRIIDIKRAVAAEYGLTVDVLSEPSRVSGSKLRVKARPRQVAMYLAHRLTRHSEARIGAFFGGRHHTTVMHAIRAVERRRREDPKLCREMWRAVLRLRGRTHA